MSLMPCKLSRDPLIFTSMENKYESGQRVNLIILRETDLGYVAEINGAEEGLLYHNEVFERLESGESRFGYIKKIRQDGGIDLQLQAFGNLGSEELGLRILDALKNNEGFLPVNDKSSAEKIYQLFAVSKKKYKMALGGLYKRRLIKITEEGIESIGP